MSPRWVAVLAACGALRCVGAGMPPSEEIFKAVSVAETALTPLPFSAARAYAEGFTVHADEAVCDNGTNAVRTTGVHWALPLNQTVVRSFVVTAEGCAEDRASGAAGPRLYVDLIYADGTHRWGVQTPFRTTGEKTWDRQTLSVHPEKPVKMAHVYLLHRDGPGRVRFRRAGWREMSGDVFDGVDVKKVLPLEAPCFLVRDVAARTGFRKIDRTACGLQLTVKQIPAACGRIFDVTVESPEPRDRAVTLVYAVPAGTETVWHADPRTSVPLAGEQRVVTLAEAGTGALARWPFAAVTADGAGRALGVDPSTFAFYRVGANAAARVLFLAFDLGFAKEKPRAHVRFCTFGFTAEHGFRGALERYRALYPEAARVRISKHGVWMPFHQISKVRGWEDFGFRFKEGEHERAWDAVHGMLTFRYTEPCTFWMTMPRPPSSYTVRELEAEVARLAQAGNAKARGWAGSVFRDRHGAPVYRTAAYPWCNGVVWSLNSAPGLPGETDWNAQNGARFAAPYPPDAAGEYIDSSELYVTAALDFDRSHFAGMTSPLCFSRDDARTGVFNATVVYEYVKGLAERLHPMGKYTMANYTPCRWNWLAPYLDVMGQETDWNPKDPRTGVRRWFPLAHDELMYRRAMCGGKPFCFLMNTDFDRFTHAMCERFMQRALAYGMFPGFFSADAATGHYFSRPDLYDRDRALFKKYIPLCRDLSEAGWRPVNRLVASDNPDIAAEQFGTEPGRRWVSVFNLTATPQTGLLRQLPGVRLPATREAVTGQAWSWKDGTCTVTLPPDAVRVLAF